MGDINVFDVLLKERGMRPSDLAERSGVAAPTVYAITGGRTKFEKIGVTTFIKLAQAMGYDAEELYDVGKSIENGTYCEYDFVSLSPEEQRREKLIADYDSLSDEKKAVAETVLDALAKAEPAE